MAIQPIKYGRLKEISGKNYVCDLCGTAFKHKCDAKAHHISMHVSDKTVLNKVIGKWYRRGIKDRYARIVDIDYQRDSVKLFCVVIHDFPVSTFTKDVYFNISMKTEYMDIDSFKKDFICSNSMWKSEWEEVNKIKVYCAINEATDYLFDRLAVEGDLNGN